MNEPKVSVIIPAYNGARFLAATMRSVLEQSYSNLELVVVDDASSDDTQAVVNTFDDPRLISIVHPVNRGADVARHTGLAASTGELIAFLDQDDLYHRDKLKAHVDLYAARPEVGFTYNDRFELDYSAETVRDLWRSPRPVTLADLVLWFPIAPSDVVLRRNWAETIDLLTGSLSWYGGEIVYFGRLMLDGCVFANVPRALNYRRHHSGRMIGDLVGGCESELDAQRRILDDPRCPPAVRALRSLAHTNLYQFWAFRAFAQGATAVGRTFVREAVALRPQLVQGNPSELLNHFLINSIDDETLDHATLLPRLVAQLPADLALPAAHVDAAVAQGYALKGLRAAIWDRPRAARRHFDQAARHGAVVTDALVAEVTHKLLSYEEEFGAVECERVRRTLMAHVARVWGDAAVRRLNSHLSVNRALRRSATGEFTDVPSMLLRAAVADPRWLANRGVLSTLARSVVGVHRPLQDGRT